MLTRELQNKKIVTEVESQIKCNTGLLKVGVDKLDILLWYNFLDKGNTADLIYLALRKALDFVLHVAFLVKKGGNED